MSDFLPSTSSAFDSINLGQIEVMVDILREYKTTRTEFLKKRYVERAPQFALTLSLLSTLGLVEVKNEELYLQIPGRDVRRSPKEFCRVLLHRLLETDCHYREEAFDYLRRFYVCDGELEYRPEPDERTSTSGIRNFFIELKVVSYDERTERYLVSPDCVSLYAAAKLSNRRCSPNELRGSMNRREELGYAAEVAVVLYERQRVGIENACHVVHIALENVSAGYDIQSISMTPDLHTPRFIEVKAVSDNNFGFYWTAHEMHVAEILGPWYYLYLLPVNRQGAFATENIRIIRDPRATLLVPGGEWIVEADGIKCALKLESLTNSPHSNCLNRG